MLTFNQNSSLIGLFWIYFSIIQILINLYYDHPGWLASGLLILFFFNYVISLMFTIDRLNDIRSRTEGHYYGNWKKLAENIVYSSSGVAPDRQQELKKDIKSDKPKINFMKALLFNYSIVFLVYNSYLFAAYVMHFYSADLQLKLPVPSFGIIACVTLFFTAYELIMINFLNRKILNN